MSELESLRSPDREPTPSPRSRIRRVLSGSGDLVRVVYRDPEHIAERLTLYAVDRLGEPSREWAESVRRARPDVPPAVLADELRAQSAQVARIDGAIAGTPFFIALVPGYLNYLWQEMRMTLRTAALYDRDTQDLRVAAELLALRRVHSDAESSLVALQAVKDAPMPDRPADRRPLRTVIHSAYSLLIFGGFMEPPSGKPRTGWRARVRVGLGVAIAGAIWVVTWVFPVTFMVAMAWGCETHTRQLGRRTAFFYGGEEKGIAEAIRKADTHQDRGHDKRVTLRTLILFLSIAIPIAFVAYVNHVRNTVGINWLGALGAVVALSIVIATAVVSSRR